MDQKNDAKKKQPTETSRSFWDVPIPTALTIFVGNLILFLVGFSMFKHAEYESPALLELATLLLIDAAILYARWKLPKTWSKVSGEKL